MSQLQAKATCCQNDKGDKEQKKGHYSVFCHVKAVKEGEIRETEKTDEHKEMKVRESQAVGYYCTVLAHFSVIGKRHGHNEQ